MERRKGNRVDCAGAKRAWQQLRRGASGQWESRENCCVHGGHPARLTAICAVLACGILVCGMLLAATGCTQQRDGSADAPAYEEGVQLSIASLKGPTSMGLAPLMLEQQGQDSPQGQGQSQDQSQSQDGEAAGAYSFDVVATADAIVPLVVQKKADIALVPANLASILYQKTQGGVTVVDINTLGVLYGVSQSDAFTDIASLRGATLYMTGKGTVPQYALDALLAASDMTETDLTVEFKSEPAEVVAAISADETAIGILPQPYATAAVMKNAALSVCLDITQLWAQTMGSQAGQMLTGVTIVRTEVLQQHPQAVARFVADHARSVESVNANPQAAAPAVVAAGILDNEAVATQAIPACNIVCIRGAAMKDALAGYLQVLFRQDAASVGGALPKDDFYFAGF